MSNRDAQKLPRKWTEQTISNKDGKEHLLLWELMEKEIMKLFKENLL